MCTSESCCRSGYPPDISHVREQAQIRLIYDKVSHPLDYRTHPSYRDLECFKQLSVEDQRQVINDCRSFRLPLKGLVQDLCVGKVHQLTDQEKQNFVQLLHAMQYNEDSNDRKAWRFSCRWLRLDYGPFKHSRVPLVQDFLVQALCYANHLTFNQRFNPFSKKADEIRPHIDYFVGLLSAKGVLTNEQAEKIFKTWMSKREQREALSEHNRRRLKPLLSRQDSQQTSAGDSGQGSPSLSSRSSSSSATSSVTSPSPQGGPIVIQVSVSGSSSHQALSGRNSQSQRPVPKPRQRSLGLSMPPGEPPPPYNPVSKRALFS